jgi:catechol 2,3-dioxygenase-like lactoylglutathione lyase family enzyme
MLESAHPKLPMRNRDVTLEFYEKFLGFKDVSEHLYPNYLILKRNDVELHFFLFENLNKHENYGQVYIRVYDINTLYHELVKNQVSIHPNGKLELKPWKQLEFSVLDPDHNLLTFGEGLSK